MFPKSFHLPVNLAIFREQLHTLTFLNSPLVTQGNFLNAPLRGPREGRGLATPSLYKR